MAAKEGEGDNIDNLAKGSIRGVVKTSEGFPAPLVTITLAQTEAMTVSDDDGFFVFQNLNAGTYNIRVSFIGLASQEKQVFVAQGKQAILEFSLLENAKKLEDVVVRTRRHLNNMPLSVGKVAIHPMDLPQSIAVVGQDVIRSQQALRLSDVVRNVNGVYLSTTRGSTQESFSARGYGFSSTNMFKNGARVNSGAMPEMSSLDKVEVLKGSAAILYGQVAPGGIINMVTKQPRFNFGGEVSFRAGSYDLYKPSFDVYGPATENIAYRLNGTYESAHSYRDVVSSKRYYINPSVLARLGKRTELLVQADYLKHEFTPDFGIGTLAETNIPNVPRNAFFGTNWQYATTNQATASAELKHQFSDNWKINFTANHQNYQRDYFSTERIQADASGNYSRRLNKTDTREDYYLAQLDLTGKFKTGQVQHTLLAGIDADKYYTTTYSFNQPAVYDTINILDPEKFAPRTDMPTTKRTGVVKTPINRMGAYVQDLISFSDKIKLLAGVRFSYQEGIPATTTNLVTNAVTKGIAKYDHAFSPRVGLVYRPVYSTSLFASYANSFSVNNGTDVHGDALEPSIIDQYEVGVKNDLIKNKLSLNVTGYRIINNNLAQVAQFGADGVTPNTNTSLKELTGQTTSDGVEVDIQGQPTAGLDLIAGYSFNNMRYTKTPETKGNYVEGERLVNSPAHTANASIFYAFKSKSLKGLRLGATAFYTGDRFAGWNNTKEQTMKNRLIPVSGFTTIDITAGYTFKHLSLLTKVSNLSDALNYYVHENYSVNPIAPRQVSATVSYRF